MSFENLPEPPSANELQKWNIRARLPATLAIAKKNAGKEPDDDLLFQVVASTALTFTEARIGSGPAKELMELKVIQGLTRGYLLYNVARAMLESGLVKDEMRAMLEIFCDWLYPVFKQECDKLKMDAKPHAGAYVGV